jgi:hypothetical protein
MYYLQLNTNSEVEKSLIDSLENFGLSRTKNIVLGRVVVGDKSLLNNKANASFVLAEKISSLSKPELEQIKNAIEEKKILFVLDLGLDLSFTNLAFNQYLQGVLQSDDHYLKTVAQNLGEFVEMGKLELQKIKSLHEKIVPLRSENVKGIKILSKYAAGQSSGGDFFDIIKSDKSIVFLLFSSSSYISSTVVLSEFEKISKGMQITVDGLEKFVYQCHQSIKELGAEEVQGRHLLDIFIGMINLNNYKFEGYNFGSIRLLSPKNCVSSNDFPLDKAFRDKAFFSINLTAEHKYFILSPGVGANSDGIIGHKSVEKFCLEDGMVTRSEDFINETFFQLKKKLNGGFLKYDCSSIVIEVPKNIIKSV